MNSTNKVMGVGILVIFVALLGVLLLRDRLRPQSTILTETKIGVILPLSGDLSFIGEEIQKGIKLAQAEAKTAGFQAELIYEDDQSLNPTATVSAANKLTQIDQVNVGLTALVDEAQPIAHIFTSAKTPLLVTWDSNKFISEAGEYLFSTGFSTEIAGETMATYVYQTLGLRRIALVAHVNPWADVIAPSFQARFEQLGGSIVFRGKHQVTDNDYRTTIAQAKETNPDGVYFALIPPTSANFLNQSKELGLGGVFLTGDALLQDVIVAAGAAAENVYFTNIFTNKTETLTAAYQAAFNSEPIDITMVSFGYDGFNIIKQAAEKSTDLHDGLLKVIGPTRTLNRIEKIYQVKAGVPQLIQ